MDPCFWYVVVIAVAYALGGGIAIAKDLHRRTREAEDDELE